MTFFDDALTYLEAAEGKSFDDPEEVAKVDRWVRLAEINALLAIAEALQSHNT